MDILQAIIMGIIQGLSEFLPISSSAHLVFSSNLYKIINATGNNCNINQEVFFDIMLHFGTLIAVLIFFRHEIMEIIKALYIGIKTKNYSEKNFKLGLYIIMGTFLTIITAFPLKEIAEKLVFKPFYVGIILFLTGIILLFSEFIEKKIKDKKTISIKSAILMGIAQGLAAIPGFSRSGLTISTGLLCGNSRAEAAKYSFLLSIPIIFGTSLIYPIFSFDFSNSLSYNWYAVIIGTIVSGIVGYFCIKCFLKFVSKFSLSVFGYYCIIVGVIAILFFNI